VDNAYLGEARLGRVEAEGEAECVDRTPPCHLEMHLSTFGQSVLQMAEVFYLNEESKTNPDFSALILYFLKLNNRQAKPP